MLDFGNLPSNDFEAMPDDRYNVELIEAKMGLSKANNKKIICQFAVTDGEFAKRRLWNDFSLVPSAQFMLKIYFEAAGLETDKKLELDDIPELIQGSKCSVFLKNGNYNGKPSTNLENWAETQSEGGETSYFDAK